MCEPPVLMNGVPDEKPAFQGASALNASWSKKDFPLYLHTFEYLVRHALLDWWRQIAPPGSEPSS